MRISAVGLSLIKRYEGYSATPYICPAGWWTIGYGHVISAADAKRFAGGILLEDAESLLRFDVAKAEAAVGRLIAVPLTQGQFDALVSFTFNLGSGRLQSSTMRRKLNKGDHEGARAELHKWVYGGGKKLPGLIARRAAEAELFDATLRAPRAQAA